MPCPVPLQPHCLFQSWMSQGYAAFLKHSCFFKADPPTGIAFTWGLSQDVKHPERRLENSVVKMVYLSLPLGKLWNQSHMFIFLTPHSPSQIAPKEMEGKGDVLKSGEGQGDEGGQVTLCPVLADPFCSQGGKSSPGPLHSSLHGMGSDTLLSTDSIPYIQKLCPSNLPHLMSFIISYYMTRLVWNPQRATCFCFPSAGVKSMCHTACLVLRHSVVM